MVSEKVIINGEEFKLGDHIYINRKFFNSFVIFSHHGVLTRINPIGITHLTGHSGIVVNDSFNNFVRIHNRFYLSSDYKIKKVKYTPEESFEKMLARLKKMIDIDPFWQVQYNCEHFCSYLKSGKSSLKINSYNVFKIYVCFIFLLLIIYVLVKNRKKNR